MYSTGRAAEGEGRSVELDCSQGHLETSVRPRDERRRTRIPRPLRPARPPRRAAGQRSADQTGHCRRHEVRGDHWWTAAGHRLSGRSGGVHTQGPRRSQSTEKSPHQRRRFAQFSCHSRRRGRIHQWSVEGNSSQMIAIFSGQFCAQLRTGHKTTKN